MKRRNAECGKLRRPIKRNKIAEGMYGSNTLLYVKYLVLWAVVIIADFMLDFRFEFLWPFWLLLRSVYDSFKYKGLAFSILFVCIAITSDLVCLFFIPVSWLFFLASTYVWVQYVWHADKNFCLPTIFLWILFLYLEGAVRWKDYSKTIPQIDLCRPFAAHCIGYPVVTFGFGVRSYVSYRIRHRKQREVAKENEFYMQLLHLALLNDTDPSQDEQNAQMRQTPELLHSDKLGDIDLPISSAIIAQRIQQQQLLSGIARHGQPTASSTSFSSTSSSSTPSTSFQANNSHTTLDQPSSMHQSATLHSISYASIDQSRLNRSATPKSINHASNDESRLNRLVSDALTLTSAASNSTLNFISPTHASHTNGPTITQNGNGPHHNHNHNNNNNNNNSINHHSLPTVATSSSSSSSSSTHTQSILTYTNNRKNTDRSDKYNHDAASLNTMRTASNGLKANDTNPANSNNYLKSRSTATGAVNSMAPAITTPDRSNILRETGRIMGMIHSIKNKVFRTAATTMSTGATANDKGSTAQSSANASTTTNPLNVVNANGSNVDSVNNNSTITQAINRITSTITQSSASSSPATTTVATAKSVATVSPMNTSTDTTPFGAKSCNGSYENAMPCSKMQCSIRKCTHAPSTPAVSTTMNGVSLADTGTDNANVESDTNDHSNYHSNNGLLNGNGKEKADVKLNGNVVDYELNQLNHLQTEQHSGEIMDKSRARRNRVKQMPMAQQHTPPAIQSCDSCHKFEMEIKKCRNEISQFKQSENDLRQKCEQHSTLKSCLQVKQKENDELEKKLQEMINTRQTDRQNLQQMERRMGEERRQKQSLEAQLNNERKHRKQAEEKATRADCCHESCKMRRQVLENESKQLRRELTTVDELKKSAEQQTRNYEQELHKLESELRKRESREGTEVLMTALQAMQDKNSTLEKNLSAETRVKLDLFSALGEAKRQLEIRESVIRQKDKEILEMKAKIAQFFAVMPSVPNDSFMGQCSSAGNTILRLNDGAMQGPVSPMSSHAHISLGGSPLMNQLQNLSVFTSTGTSTSPQCTASSQSANVDFELSTQQQQQQHPQQTNNGNMDTSSSLDPNATIYTPKNDV